MPLIGWVGSQVQQPGHDIPFLEGLKDEGFVEGSNFTIQYRWAEGHYERLPGFVSEFINQRVDLIAAITTVSAVAVRDATSTIPTVFLSGTDPVKVGLVASMNRPGGNRTGVTLITHALDAKRMELLRELVPAAQTIGAILNPNSASADTNKANVQAAAISLGLRLVIATLPAKRTSSRRSPRLPRAGSTSCWSARIRCCTVSTVPSFASPSGIASRLSTSGGRTPRPAG
jgi:putative ABC transport system substrate-binding protein